MILAMALSASVISRQQRDVNRSPDPVLKLTAVASDQLVTEPATFAHPIPPMESQPPLASSPLTKVDESQGRANQRFHLSEVVHLVTELRMERVVMGYHGRHGSRYKSGACQEDAEAERDPFRPWQGLKVSRWLHHAPPLFLDVVEQQGGESTTWT